MTFGPWPLQSECARRFGNPTTSGWGARNLGRVTPPFPMACGEIAIHSIAINKIAVDALAHVLDTYWDRIGKDEARLKADGVDVFSGSWAVRPMRGLSTLSMHAYGLAIDINAPQNPLGRAPGKTRGSFTDASLIVKCFDEVGAQWGGRWHGRPDGMHFQFARV